MRARGEIRPTIRRGSIKEFFGRNPNLKTYLPLNGNAIDESGNGNHGTIGASVVDYGGQFHTAKLFNTTANSYIAPPKNSFPLNNVALSMWIYANTLNSTQDNKSRLFSHEGFELQVSTTNNIGFWRYSGAWTGIDTTDNPIALKRWYWLIANYDGSKMSIWCNGKFKLSVAESGALLATSTLGEKIGSHNDINLNAHFDGIIEEVGIFSRGLSPTEIFQYYQWATATPRKYWVSSTVPSIYIPQIMIF